MAWLKAFQRPSTHPENSFRVPCLPRGSQRWGMLVALGITQALAQGLGAPAGQAAEQLVIHYGSLSSTIPLRELESSLDPAAPATAKSFPLAQLNREMTQRLRSLLTQPLPSLPAQQVENLFHSRCGERLLQALAEVFFVGEKLNPAEGGAALRTALAAAAASPEGMTGLNILRHFPGELHWDARRTMALWQQKQQLQQETQEFLASLDQRLELDAALEGPGGQEDLRLPGNHSFRQGELQLWDEDRDRPLLVQLYLPDTVHSKDAVAEYYISHHGAEDIPLMIMSHGLSANRHSRQFFAKHLASHGIAVAMVQHWGSDSDQFHAMLQGQVDHLASPKAFIDRPLDISFVLDELDRLSSVGKRSSVAITSREGDGEADREDDRSLLQDYPLQLDRVAFFGHSLGAYTGLAIAGAEINFQQLQQDCQPDAMLLDLSLVLQCQALELASVPLPNLKDARVSALMLADPMSRSIFGPQELQKIQLPVVWTGGDRDSFTPFSFSQLPSFDWLGSEHKYLAVAEATRHLYLNSESLEPRNGRTSASSDSAVVEDKASAPAFEAMVAAQPQPVQDYTNALGLAFTRTYLDRDAGYQSYLTASYGRQLSQSPYHLRLWSPQNNAPQQPPSQLASFQD